MLAMGVSPAGRRERIGFRSDNFQKQKDQDDGKDQAEATTAIVSPSRSDTVTAISESKDENDKNDNQQHAISSAGFDLLLTFGSGRVEATDACRHWEPWMHFPCLVDVLWTTFSPRSP